MLLALSENAVDLLGELLQKERDAMDNTDPNDEECFFSQEEYDSRMAALDELEGIAYKYEWDESDTEARVKACGKRLSYAEWKDSLEREWWFERWKNEIEDMPNGSPEKEDEWDKYAETVGHHAELAVHMQGKEES